jgi:hypothetical protein
MIKKEVYGFFYRIVVQWNEMTVIVSWSKTEHVSSGTKTTSKHKMIECCFSGY